MDNFPLGIMLFVLGITIIAVLCAYDWKRQMKTKAIKGKEKRHLKKLLKEKERNSEFTAERVTMMINNAYVLGFKKGWEHHKEQTLQMLDDMIKEREDHNEEE